MKKIFFLFALLLSSLTMSSQDIQKMQEEINSLKARVTILEQLLAARITTSSTSQTNTLNNSASILDTTQNQGKSTTIETKRCVAITNAGTQCKRNADPGSNYCWQHKTTYEPTKSSSNSSSTTTSKSSTSSSSRTILTGPRGGKYYINSKGNKTYIKKK